MINTIDGIIAAAKGGKTGVIAVAEMVAAVAAAHPQPVIEAVVEARREGIAAPILVGHTDEIKSMLTALGEDPAAYEIIVGDTDEDCAAKAVALCAEGRANFLMKGILGTADLMRAVFNKEHGLRTDHLTTHCMLYEIPALGRMLVLTDGGVNTFPDLEKKAEILENAAMVLQALGYEHINASCVCGAEQVNPKVQSTVDADALSHMTDRWAKYNMGRMRPRGSGSGCQRGSVPPQALHRSRRRQGGHSAGAQLRGGQRHRQGGESVRQRQKRRYHSRCQGAHRAGQPRRQCLFQAGVYRAGQRPRLPHEAVLTVSPPLRGRDTAQ